jgi:hypothetical protein
MPRQPKTAEQLAGGAADFLVHWDYRDLVQDPVQSGVSLIAAQHLSERRSSRDDSALAPPSGLETTPRH